MSQLVIGTVTAQLTPDEVRLVPDDRQEQVKTMTYSAGSWLPSLAVVDGGMCEAGEVMTVSGAQFTLADWNTLFDYWTNRTLVSVTDLSGTARSGCRIVVKGWTQNKRFSVVSVDLEVWRT